MTTPAERFRALRQGAQLLVLLQSDNAAPTSLRSQAGQLEFFYPRHDQLLDLLGQMNAHLPRAMAESIFEVGKLFEVYGKLDGMAVDVRQLWRSTMRHYPARADGWHSPEALEAIGVTEFLRADLNLT